MKKIINARLVGEQELKQIWVNQEGVIEKIKSMGEGLPDGAQASIIDVNGDWVSLGGVDLQINGGLGLAFPDVTGGDIDKLDEICAYLWREGVDGFLPTIVTTSVENFVRSLEILTEYKQKQKEKQAETAKILGVHLEGPFLNYEKRGAHRAEYLLQPSVEALKRILGDYGETVKIVTLAPELEGALEVIDYLKEQGITISLGHSQASAQEAREAFNRGASMVTHAFNAMPSLHHRQPGLLAEAIINKNVYCGLIADGCHVTPLMIEILLRASEYEKGVFLVSDALAPMGLPDGIYPWDSRQIEVKDGTARLADGTLSGTTLPLLALAQNLLQWELCEPEQAIALVSDAPRKALGIWGMSVGARATLLRWRWHQSSGKLHWERIN